ncbi:hypothetical protein DER44DRAFT_834834 [Fusarium oxysporum]|nr:hypothetical protein DER44DRAFT_834834 [Fusarium oxysporum]
MNSWDTPAHGVPSQVFERLERNEPSAREKAQTAHIVPPTERGIDDHDPIDIQEIVGALLEEQNALGVATGYDCVNRDDERGADDKGERLYKTGSSVIFDLDDWPDIADAAKLRYLLESMGEAAVEDQGRRNAWRASVKVRHDRVAEPYITISRGEDVADPFDTWHLASAFPSLLPRGMGGPRQAEEWVVAEREVALQICEAEFAARRLVSSRNMTLEAWAKLVQQNGGRFASHLVILFLVFNIRVRSRNRRVSMASIRKSDFPQVEHTTEELTAARLEKASIELESSGKTADPAVNQLLRSLSLYGYRQPIIPAIWFMLNPNDIINPIKLKLTACRTRETEEAEKFLGLDQAYKRARLAISDPVSSAIFFHREVPMFFEHYVNVGEESVFGLVSQSYGAVETNERGALHLHGLLWLQGNMHLSTLSRDVQGEEHVAYRKRVIDYVDSIFSEDLDEGASAVVRAESTDRNGSHNVAVYRPDGIGAATRLIDVLRNAITRTVITAASKELSAIVEQMYQFQETALASEEDLNAAIILNDGLSPPQGTVSSTGTPRQEQLRAIKSQQISLSRDREKAFQGMQSWPGATIPIDRATARGGSEDLEQQNGQAATADWMEDTNPSTSIMFGLFTSFCEVRRQVAKSLTPNRRQSIAFWLICRQLDQVRRDEHCTAQLCLFIGGNGGTGKSRVIAAIAELFAVGHSRIACSDTSTRTGAPSSSAGRRIDGQAKMDWQEKYALIIDEVGMLGARMLYAVNVQLRRLRESTQDFGDIPVIIFCGDFHQFRPVQEWSILLPSSSFPRGQGHGFGLEQQRQHDVAYVLWRKFTVVVPKEKVRAAQDPRLRRLITRVEFLNSNGYHEERRIPWESEATLAFQRQRHAPLHTFVSEHKWKDGKPTEEEAVMMLGQGDDSATIQDHLMHNPT